MDFQKTLFDFNVGLEGLCVFITHFTAYIHILRCNYPEVRMEQWLKLRFTNQEVSGSNAKLDRLILPFWCFFVQPLLFGV